MGPGWGFGGTVLECRKDLFGDWVRLLANDSRVLGRTLGLFAPSRLVYLRQAKLFGRVA